MVGDGCGERIGDGVGEGVKVIGGVLVQPIEIMEIIMTMNITPFLITNPMLSTILKITLSISLQFACLRHPELNDLA